MNKNLEVLAAEVVERALKSTSQLHLIVTATDNDALLAEECLRQLAGNNLSHNDIAGLPAFVQTGVYRFESARRLLARRLGTLHLLRTHPVRCLVVSAPALMRVVPHPRWLKSFTHELQVGRDHDQDIILDQLLSLGYQSVQRVSQDLRRGRKA